MSRLYVRLTCLLPALFLTSSWVHADDDAPVLRVPAGFTVEKVAGPPLVERPLMGGFDDRGRLFLAESAGKNLDFKELQKQLPNFIRMLEDTDGDGVFDRSNVFADRMTFPSGALWHNGALYVCSPPSLWKLEDTNDDGVCDRRTEIVKGFGSIGNAADMHGPFLGPEGWLYFCDGRNGHDVTLGDGTRWKGKAACVYRCKFDGSGLEVVFGGGMDNPVECVFTPEGELLVSCNLVHARPHRVDGILYGLEGAVFPYDACISEFPRTGPLFEPAGDLGWVAVSGLARYEGSAVGKEFTGSLFSAPFNPHRVQRHKVERDGAGFRVSSEDFLTCDHVDFHPTDVIEDADGSLLVIDTGGWFRIGCPNSQIEKPNVLGGIYRVRRTDAPEVDDPRGMKLRWENVDPETLIARLSDARPIVVEKSVKALGQRRDDATFHQLEELVHWGRGPAVIPAIWALARSNHPTAAEVLRLKLATAGGDPSALRAALHALGLKRSARALQDFLHHVDGTLGPGREAASAVGRLKDRRATPVLLEGLEAAGDVFYEHAVIHALIRIADRDGTAAGLSSQFPGVRRGSLISLDQMQGGDLKPHEVIPLLGDKDARVRQEAMRVATARPAWASDVASHLRNVIAAPLASDAERESLRNAVIAFAADGAVQAMVGDAVANDATLVPTRTLLLDAMAQAPVDPLPERWRDAARKAIGAADPATAWQAIAFVRGRGMTDFDALLTTLARDENQSVDIRIACLTAAAPRLSATPQDLDFLLAHLDPSLPADLRLSAARCLGVMSLDDASLQRVAAALRSAGPLEATQLMPLFERSRSADVGRTLVDALHQSKAAAATFTPATLLALLKPYPPEVLEAAKPLLARLESAAADQRSRLAQLEPLLTGGNPNRGQSVFFGKTAACATCHMIDGRGAQVGPDLTKIGAIRGGRDLLESIIFPSASIARGFESFVIETTDRQTHAGTLAGETVDAVRLKTPADVRVPRAKIKSLRQDRVSIMPQGLEAQLSPQELSDLLAFLQSLK